MYKTLVMLCLLLGVLSFPAFSIAGVPEPAPLEKITDGNLISQRTPQATSQEQRRGTVILPAPDYRGLTLEETINRRRSVRAYAAGPLSLAAISQLAHAAQGITGRLHGHRLRAAPSAGALYPFDLYIMAGQVENLPAGLWRYEPEGHSLILIREGDFRATLTRASLGQQMIARAPATFILAAVPARTQARYGERSMRYIYMEAGHISQNLYLQATSLGLGTVVIGAFNDEAVNSLMQFDGRRETVVIIQPIGPQAP